MLGELFTRATRRDNGKPAPSKRSVIAAVIVAVIVPLYFFVPTLLDATDIDPGKKALSYALGDAMPTFPPVEFLGKDQPAVASFLRDSGAVFIYYLVGVLLAFISYLHWARSWIRSELKRDVDEIEAKVGNADEIRRVLAGLDRLHEPTSEEHVSFAIFDKLLIYSPLYIAHGVGYFGEEGISANFEVTGDDRAVAAAVREGNHLFGACDPFMCVPDSPKAAQDADDLLVLFPLIKRYGFFVFGSLDALAKLDRGEGARIGAYEEGSTSYLAGQAFKRWLVDNMQHSRTGRANTANKIRVHSIDVGAGALGSEGQIAQTLSGLDFVVLWEPQVSQVLASKRPVLSSFGVVALSSEDNAPLFKVFRQQPVGASGMIDEKWKAWVPGTNHQCLISAVVTRRATLRDQPNLCRRVYRALSRSSMHLHSVDWELDQHVLESVRDQIKDASNIDQQMLDRMVRGGLAGTDPKERGGLFPFVHGWPRSKTPPYRAHLLACHSLWHENDAKTPPVWSLSDYDRCFVQLEDLKKGKNAA